MGLLFPSGFVVSSLLCFD
jgi:hypothetical protein